MPSTSKQDESENRRKLSADAKRFPAEFADGERVVGLLTADEERAWAARRAAMLGDLLMRRSFPDISPMPRAPRPRTFARAAA